MLFIELILRNIFHYDGSNRPVMVRPRRRELRPAAPASRSKASPSSPSAAIAGSLLARSTILQGFSDVRHKARVRGVIFYRHEQTCNDIPLEFGTTHRLDRSSGALRRDQMDKCCLENRNPSDRSRDSSAQLA